MKPIASLALAGLFLLSSQSVLAGLIIDPSSEYTSWARTTHWGHNNTSSGSISLPGSGTEVATQYDSGSSTSSGVRNRSTTNYAASGDSSAANFLFDWTHDPNGTGNVRSFGTVYFSVDDYYLYDISGFYDFAGSGSFGSQTSELRVRITDVVSATDVVDISLSGNGHQDLTLSGAGLSGSLAAGDYSFYFFSRIKDTNGVDSLDRAGEVSFSMTAVNAPATGMVLGLGMTMLMWRRRGHQEA